MELPDILPRPEGARPFFPPARGRACRSALKSFFFAGTRAFLNFSYADLSDPPDVDWVAAGRDGEPIAWAAHAQMAGLRAAAKPSMRPLIVWDESCAAILPAGIPLVPLRTLMGDWLGRDYSRWRDPLQFYNEMLVGLNGMDLPELPWADNFPPEPGAPFSMRILLRGCAAMEQMLRAVAASYYLIPFTPEDF